MRNKKIPIWCQLAVLFAVTAVVYGLLATYPRQLAIYSDELRYLDVARSLFHGQGLQVRNLPSDYQKILYPLLLLPALLCKTTAGQITAIGWLNAVYMASAVFPAYLLAKRTGQSRGRTVFLLAVTVTLPTMAAVSGFMSETVFLPFSLWMVLLWLRAFGAADAKRRAAWCAVCGVWCYLLYLNKEIALYYPLAYLLTRAWWLAHHRAAWRGEVLSWAALAVGFGGCFVAAKLTLFAGLGNSYNQMGWLDAEQWAYFPFALALDTLFFVLAFGVAPVLVPLAALRRPVGDAKQQRDAQLPLFLLLCLAIGIGVVVYSITVREDLWLGSPRQHTRYVEPLLLPLLMVTLNALDAHWTAARRRVLVGGAAVWAVGFVALCDHIGQGAADNTFLQWFDFVADRVDQISLLQPDTLLLAWRAVAALAAVALCAALARYTRHQPGAVRFAAGGAVAPAQGMAGLNSRKEAGAAAPGPEEQQPGVARPARLLPALGAGTVALCLLCNAGEQRINRWSYAVPAETAQAASDLNDALYGVKGNVLFIAATVRGRDSQLIDTYLDRPVYLCEYDQLAASGFLADGVLDLTTEHPAPEYPGTPYTDLTAADWLLVTDGVPVDTTTLTPATDLPCPVGYTLYRNATPGVVGFVG